MGIETNEFPAGESTVMNLTDPTNPAWSGMMQTGIGSDGYVTVTQSYSELKESTDTTTTQPDAVASDDGSVSISE